MRSLAFLCGSLRFNLSFTTEFAECLRREHREKTSFCFAILYYIIDACNRHNPPLLLVRDVLRIMVGFGQIIPASFASGVNTLCRNFIFNINYPALDYFPTTLLCRRLLKGTLK